MEAVAACELQPPPVGAVGDSEYGGYVDCGGVYVGLVGGVVGVEGAPRVGERVVTEADVAVADHHRRKRQERFGVHGFMQPPLAGSE